MKYAVALIMCMLYLQCFVGCDSADLISTTQLPTQSLEQYTTIPSSSPSSAYQPEDTEPVDDPEDTYISRFLTDVNFNGVIDKEDETVPPGTLPEVSKIPKADDTLVGTEVLINLDNGQSPVTILYQYNPHTGTERLVAIISCDNIPMLIIFRPEFGGVSALCEAMLTGDPFYATILSITNISPQEAMYAFSASENRGENPVDFSNPQYIDGYILCFVGFIGTQYGQTFTELFYANDNALEVYGRIFVRFALDMEMEFTP